MLTRRLEELDCRESAGSVPLELPLEFEGVVARDQVVLRGSERPCESDSLCIWGVACSTAGLSTSPETCHMQRRVSVSVYAVVIAQMVSC